MPRSVKIPLATLLVGSLLQLGTAGELARRVNPFVGTDGHGHTFPGATIPFGMVQLSPDTRIEGWDACAGYHYSDSLILGFSHTHLSGTGVADYGDILLAPGVGAFRPHASRFTHRSEQASPGYYQVMLDGNINVELTATARAGMHRYTFPQSDSATVMIDLHHGLGPDRVIASNVEILNDHEIAGERRSAGWAKDQHLYFWAACSKPFLSSAIAVNDTLGDAHSASGTNLRAFVRFATAAGERVIVKVGISAVSREGARRNLLAELPGWDFSAVRAAAEQAWEEELSRITVEGGSEEETRTFYTALYHSLIAPNLFSDVDGSYRGMDGAIHNAGGSALYTVFSLWDTFRAEHPLLTIIDQKRTLEFVNSLLAKGNESGVLPVWELAANETWCMIGYHAVPVIVDAYVKGIRGFDAEGALRAMKHGAELDQFGLAHYKEHGYIPGDKEPESVSKTLEYAYDDWCIAQMARSLGQKEDASRYSARAQSWRNLVDRSTGFMRPLVNGMWLEPFDPTAVTNHYTEANAWQYSFFVPHDVDGLMSAFGGRAKFAAKLDSLFSTSAGLTGRQQADISGMIGQYAQGNEPSHHVAYLYNYAGVPWKTQEITHRIMRSLFTPNPDGLCGNDDCGQMSAWYVMSALGLYQVCPGQPEYCLSSPLFSKATIRLENGRTFVISAPGASRENQYIQSMTLNGRSHGATFLPHAEIMKGGEARFVLGPKPSRHWGRGPKDAPHSLAVDPLVTVPVVAAAGKMFKDSLRLSLDCATPGAAIRYTTDGAMPTASSRLYTAPVVITASTTLRAFASKPGMESSRPVTAEFVRNTPIGSLALHSVYSPQYTGGGPGALVDGLRGEKDFRLGAWQGYEGTDLDAVLDLGSVREIREVSLGCLQDNPSWIFFPTQVAFAFSSDSATWTFAAVVPNGIPQKEETATIQQFRWSGEKVSARYIRLHASNIKECPAWHRGAGAKAWLFADEITVH